MPIPSTSLLQARLDRLRAALSQSALDTFVVTSQTNIRYLTNHVGSAGIAVVSGQAVDLVVDGRYQEVVQQRQASPQACPALRIRPVPESYESALAECLRSFAAARAGFEAGDVTVARHDAWRRALGAVGAVTELIPTVGVVEGLRVVKDDVELATLRDAAARLTAVAARVFDGLAPGRAEREVAGDVEAALRAAGFERPSFETIVAAGPHAALPHHRAGDRRLGQGDLVVLDFGGVLDGYCSDLTRTVSIGPPSAEAIRVHAAVCEAQAAAIGAVRPGVLPSEVDAAARSVLERHGLASAFSHGTGHGLGLDIHEEPRVGLRRPDLPERPLSAGMVITIEPGAYLPGWGGVRIEDDILVTADGGVVLTDVPRDLRIIH